MRLVTEKAIKSLLNGKNACISNTTVADNRLYLFGNCIAKIEDGKLFVRMCGWNTPVTRERLNGFKNFGYKISVRSKDFTPYINNEVMDDMAWYPVDKI